MSITVIRNIDTPRTPSFWDDDWSWTDFSPVLSPEEQACLEEEKRLSEEKRRVDEEARNLAQEARVAWLEIWQKSWKTDPFRLIQLPFGAYLEPDGYAAMRAMSKPNFKSYAKRMPLTYALAEMLFESIQQKSVWGKQTQKPDEKVSWSTLSAHKWIKAKHTKGPKKGETYHFPQQAMELIDVINMLANPDRFAIGNVDRSTGIRTRVKHIRIDIDMDRVFNTQDIDDLRGEIALIHDIFAHFGLQVYIFRTGNRGIQAVTSIPMMARREASILTECVRTVLAGTKQRHWQAKDFQTSLEGIMRLPLGRHGFTHSLGAFLGRDGAILPVEEQVVCAVEAFAGKSDIDTSWITELSAWAHDQFLAPWQPVKNGMLRDLASAMPENALIGMFLDACERFEVRGWTEEKSNELVTHTNTCVLISRDDVVSDNSDSNNKSSTWRSPAKLKQIGWDILNAAFAPGESFSYYVNELKGVKGKNAIGWALVVFDGDAEQAKTYLINQAKEIPASSPEAIDDRVNLIKWALQLVDEKGDPSSDGKPRNNTYERFQQRSAMSKYRKLSGELLKDDTDRAQMIINQLPALRKASSCRTKTWQPKALSTIKHILELAQLGVCNSDDGFLRVSYRTLAAEISERWPDDAVNRMDVCRQMEWIIANHSACIYPALIIIEKPVKATDPTVYALTDDFLQLVPVE